jgi:hypothetical protein
LVGPIAFNGAGLPPFAARNICKTPLVGGQWRLKDGGGYDLVIVDNSDQPSIPTGGTMEEIAFPNLAALKKGARCRALLPTFPAAWSEP